jgi:RNA polymerase sigma-70 factor (ECF subfamily)
MTAGNTEGVNHYDKARRFRDAALPHLNDVYTLARYLLRDAIDAEDAVQECSLRALRHFDTFRRPEIKPWLFAILRNICLSEFTRRSCTVLTMDGEKERDPDAVPLWQEPPPTPEKEILHERDTDTVCRLVADLLEPFREAIVLREINDLSYREIADLVGAPLGTVMSRLARARCLLRNPANVANTATTLKDVESAARVMGLQIQIFNASTRGEIDAVFASLVVEKLDALFVGNDAFFNSRRMQLALLAARHAVPAVYASRDYVDAGGLMSYGTNSSRTASP